MDPLARLRSRFDQAATASVLTLLRRTPLMLALGFLAASILSCVSLAPSNPEGITLSFLIGAQEVGLWQPIIAEFEAAHPDITLQPIEGPTASNLIEDLYSSSFLLGESPYDLIYMDVPWVPKFAAGGWLLDLSDRLPEDDRSDFLQGDLEGGSYAGKLYRMPLRTDAGMLYYRTDLLSQAGVTPPETFAELKTAAQAVQAHTQRNGSTPDGTTWGWVWQGKQYEGLAAMFVEILTGHGGYWVNPETREVGLDRPEAIAAVDFLISTMEEGISPPGVTTYQEEETRRFFQNGQAVFLRNWPYVWPLAQGKDSAVAGKIAIKPMVHAEGQRSGACLGGWGWGIASTTQHPDQAWEAVEFLSSAASQKAIALAAGYLPTRRSLYQDSEIVEKYPHFPSMLSVLENSALRPPIAQYAQASDILQRYLSAALTGRISSQRAMAAAATETRQLLGVTGAGSSLSIQARRNFSSKDRIDVDKTARAPWQKRS